MNNVHCFEKNGGLCISEAIIHADVPMEEEDIRRDPECNHELSWEGVRYDENKDEEDPTYHGTVVEECLYCYTKLVKRAHELMIEKSLRNWNVLTCTDCNDSANFPY